MRHHGFLAEQAANAFHPESLAKAELMQARNAMVRAYGPERYAVHVRATMARPDRSVLLDHAIPPWMVTASHDDVVPTNAVTQYAATIHGARIHLVQAAGQEGLADARL